MSEPTPTTVAAKSVELDVDVATDESAGVVSTNAVQDPIIPPTDEPQPATVEDLFRVGEEERAKEEAPEQPAEQPESAPEQPQVPPPAPAPAPVQKHQKKPTPPAEPVPQPPLPQKPEEPNTLDELVEQPEQNTDDDDDDTPVDLKINSILFGKLDEALDEIRQTYTTAKDFDAAQDDPNSLLSKYMTTAMHGWPTGRRNFLVDILELRDKIGDKLVQQAGAEIPAIVDGRPAAVHKHGANLNGKEAAMILQSCLGGLHRVCLLNSGFWVVLRAPGMDELNELFNTIDAEGRELGRSLGAHFALISDMYIKRKFLELLIKRRIIVESNFENIYDKDEFEKALSFHDYDALMHGLLSICTRKGLRMQMYCPKCHEESEETRMDISACKFIDRSLMTDAMIAHWNRKRDAKGNRIMLGREDLRRYREMLPVKTETIVQLVNNGFSNTRVEMDLATPSFARYFRVGARLITDLTQTMNNIAKGNEDKADLIKDSLEIHGYQLIAPWVQQLRVYEDKDSKEPVLITEDTDVILDYLDGIIQDDQTLDTIGTLNEFISKTRITYIGTFSLECPHCHAKPETGGINFYPIDVHTVFFGQCFRLLRRA